MFRICNAITRIQASSPVGHIAQARPARLVILLLLFLPLLPVPEAAARNTSLILLGRLRQNITLNYGYDGAESESGGDSTSSSQHAFNESYNMGFIYALYSPQLLKGNFQGSVRLDQHLANADTSSSGQNFLYRLNGTLLEKKPYPVTFYSYSQFAREQRAFSPGYDLSTDGYGATLTFGNIYLPASLTYSRSNSSTSGQGQDTNTTSDNLSLNASNSYKTWCQTGAGVSFASADTRSGGLGLTSATNSVDFSLINALDFGGQKWQRVIRSRYLYHEETGIREFRSSDLAETLTWELGKALSVGLGYNNRYENTDGETSLGNSGSAWLQHRLFQSLFTRLEAHTQQTDFSSGRTTDTGGSASLDYRKELPRESRLQLGYSFAHDVSDNALADNVQFANNERQTVPDLPPFEIQLKNPDVIHNAPGDIVVSTANRTFTYREGTDYRVDPRGLLTYIVFDNLPTAGPFPIATGTVLSIDYRFRVNASIGYATSTHSAQATLSLFGNRHRIYARVTESNQHLLSGQANSLSLNETRLYTLGFATTLPNTGFGASYRRYETVFSNSHDLEGYWRYTHNTETHNLSVNLRERFSLNETANATGRSSSINSFVAAAAFQKVLLGRVNMKATGLFTDVRGTAPLDEIVLGLDLNTRFGKSEVTLGSSVDWRFREATSERQESLHLTYTRYF